MLLLAPLQGFKLILSKVAAKFLGGVPSTTGTEHLDARRREKLEALVAGYLSKMGAE